MSDPHPPQGPQFQGPPQQPQAGQPEPQQLYGPANYNPGPVLVHPPTKPSKGGVWLRRVALVLPALFIGACAGALGDANTTTTSAVPASAPTATVTATVPGPTITSEGKPAPTVTVTAPAPEAPKTDPATFKPKSGDFKIKVKVREKKCFGSAGCNVTYRIDPDYVGDKPLPDEGEIEVFYKITGAEDPIENYFTVDSDGNASFDEEESASTSSSGATLKAKVTEVSYTK